MRCLPSWWKQGNGSRPAHQPLPWDLPLAHRIGVARLPFWWRDSGLRLLPRLQDDLPRQTGAPDFPNLGALFVALDLFLVIADHALGQHVLLRLIGLHRGQVLVFGQQQHVPVVRIVRFGRQNLVRENEFLLLRGLLRGLPLTRQVVHVGLLHPGLDLDKSDAPDRPVPVGSIDLSQHGDAEKKQRQDQRTDEDPLAFHFLLPPHARMFRESELPGAFSLAHCRLFTCPFGHDSLRRRSRISLPDPYTLPRKRRQGGATRRSADAADPGTPTTNRAERTDHETGHGPADSEGNGASMM